MEVATVGVVCAVAATVGQRRWLCALAASSSSSSSHETVATWGGSKTWISARTKLKRLSITECGLTMPCKDARGDART